MDDTPPTTRAYSLATSLSLLDQAVAGSGEAWERIVFLYAPLVSRWCRRRGLAEPDVQDVGQEVFRAVYRKLDTFRKEEAHHSFRRWLKTIAARKVLDFYRRKGREPIGRGGTSARDFLEGCCAGPSDPGDGPEEDLSESRLLLRRCLDMLRPDFEAATWAAFWAAAVEERPAAEVAAALGISRNAVYLAKSKVLRRLRDLLERFREEVPGS